MDRLRWLVFQLLAAFRRNRKEHDLDDELSFHLGAEAEAQIEAGTPPEEALIKEETRMVLDLEPGRAVGPGCTLRLAATD